MVLLPVSEFHELAISEKDRLQKALDDGSIIDGFNEKQENSIRERASDWIARQEESLDSCKDVQGVNRVLYCLESAPIYTAGVCDTGIAALRERANVMISNMKVDYMKGLFGELSSIDKQKFIEWCRFQ